MNPYHAGEIEVQKRAGVRPMAERVGRIISDTIPSGARLWLRSQQLIAVTALAPDERVWAQLLGGEPGFLSAPDERTLRVCMALASDDPLRTALEGGADVGAVVLEPPARRRMRFNGRGHLVEDGFSIRAREVYANCPQYIQARSPEEVASRATPVLVAQGSELKARERAWISGSDTFFIGSTHAQSGADCSHRGGNPGFVRVEGNALWWPDYAGNAMFNTLGNLALDGRAGLVFPDWGSGGALQLAGQARVAPEGAARRVEFEVSAWRHVAGVLPASWRFDSYSPFNPI